MARPIRILSLFSGIGGLELGVALCFGRSEVVGYVERDAYACRALVARMEESSLDPAALFVGEIQDMDSRELHGEVDLVCGGIPCQPYSLAGDRRGNEDERALWPEFARVVAECGPSLVFIENVPTFVTTGEFRPLGEELCRLGYELADPFFIGAGDVGAPHERQRVFILAYRNLDGSEDEWGFGQLDEGKWAALRNDADGCGEEMADPEGLVRWEPITRGRSPWRDVVGWTGTDVGYTDCPRWEEAGEGGQEYSGEEPQEGGSGAAVADAGRSGREGGEQRGALQGDWDGAEAHGSAPELRPPHEGSLGQGSVSDAIRHAIRDQSERGRGGTRSPESWDPFAGDLGIFPPGPDDPEWEPILWHQPFLCPAIEPGLRVVADGVPLVLDESHPDQLRCAGNAVVVPQAMVAFQWLFQEAMKGGTNER